MIEPWRVGVTHSVNDTGVVNILVNADSHLDATLSVALLDALFYFLRVPLSSYYRVYLHEMSYSEFLL